MQAFFEFLRRKIDWSNWLIIFSTLPYCFGNLDESVGRLTQNEQALLITRQANLLEFDGGHQETIEGLLDEGFEMAFGEE
ncbi:MAG: hypothetical protein AB8G86_14920 [Saprospiraceae bacterium]